MEVDDESKKAVSDPVVTVDATKVAEEKEEEADVEGEGTMGTKGRKLCEVCQVKLKRSGGAG